MPIASTQRAPLPTPHQLYLINSHWSLLRLWGWEEGALRGQQGAESACSLQSKRVPPPPPRPQAPQGSLQGEQTGGRERKGPW